MKSPGMFKGAAGIFLLTLIVYIPALRAGFIWDDDVWLWENKVIQSGDHWTAYWLGDRTPDYYPLTSTLFWQQYQRFGKDPTGYHVVNVLLHALGCVVLWRLFLRLRMPAGAAWVAAAVFAVHPLNVSSVAWITELKNTLSLLLYALAVLAYLRFAERPRTRWYVLSLVLFALGLFSKASGVMLPLLLPALAWWRRGRIRRIDWLRAAPFAVISLAFAYLTYAYQHEYAMKGIDFRPEGFASRVAAAGWAVWFYLFKALIPIKLAMIYPRWHVDAASPVAYLPLLTLIVGLAALWRFRRGVGKAPLLALGYFVVILAPVLGVVGMYYHRYSLVADHWQYLALPGLVVLFVAALRELLATGRAFAAVSAVIVIALGALSLRHAMAFKDPLALWSDNVAKYPNCAPAQSDLGLLLAERGDRARAIEHLTLAVKLQPNESRHHLKLGAVLAGAGQSSRGINHLLCAVALDSKDKLARRTLAGALMRLDRFAEAAEQYDAAVRLDAQDHESIVRRADALNRSGLVDEARQLLDELMRRRPFWPDAMDMRARIEAEHGDPAEAKRLAALACNQTNYQRARFVHTLALAYAAAGEVDAARQLAAQALAVAQAHDQSRTARQIRELLDDLASRGE